MEVGHKPRYKCNIKKSYDLTGETIERRTKRNGRLGNKNNKVYKRPKRIQDEGTKQVRIDKYLHCCYLDDKGSVDILEQKHSKNNDRIFFSKHKRTPQTNKENMNKSDDLLDGVALGQFKDLNVGIICLAETNLN